MELDLQIKRELENETSYDKIKEMFKVGGNRIASVKKKFNIQTKKMMAYANNGYHGKAKQSIHTTSTYQFTHYRQQDTFFLKSF